MAEPGQEMEFPHACAKFGMKERFPNGTASAPCVRSRLDPLIPLLAFLITFLIFRPFAALGVDLHHDGLMLKTALDVATGQTLYGDTFTQYGALTTYLQAWSLRLMGPSLLSLKLMSVGAYSVAGAFLVAAWRELLPRGLVVFSFVIWLGFAPFYSIDWVMHPWASDYALAFQSICLYTMIRGLKNESGAGRSAFSFLTGVSAALVFWSRTPVGVFLLAALVVIYILLAKDRLKSLLSFLGGAFLIHGVFLAEILRKHTLHAWVEQTFLWPQRWAKSLGMGPVRIFKSLFTYEIAQNMQGWVVFLRWSVTIGVVLLFAAILRQGRRDLDASPMKFCKKLAGLFVCVLLLTLSARDFLNSVRPLSFLIPVSILFYFLADIRAWYKGLELRGNRLIWALSLFCFASWMQYYPVMCFRHIYWSVSPFIGLFIHVVYRETQWNLKYLVGGIGMLVLPLLIADVQHATTKLTAPYVSLDGVRGAEGMRTTAVDAAALSEMAQAIAQYEKVHGKTPVLLDGPNALPGVFTSNLQNYAPFFVDWTENPRTPEEDALRNQFVREKHPLIIVQTSRVIFLDKWQRQFGYEILLKVKDDVGFLLAPH